MTSRATLFGSAGTGKTRAGIQTVVEYLKSGFAPAEIAYLAFTKAASRVAIRRIQKEVDVGADEFTGFRTLHAWCLREMQRAAPSKLNVMQRDDWVKFAKETGMLIAAEDVRIDDLGDSMLGLMSGYGEWDEVRRAYTLSRLTSGSIAELDASRNRPSQAALRRLGYVSDDMYRSFVSAYEKFKDKEGLVDFTDMLEWAARNAPDPKPIRKVVVDECLPAGTPIRMADGTRKRVEEVKLGDTVLGFDHRNGRVMPSTVVERREREADDLICIDDVLVLTSNHPVFVVGVGYVEARKILPKDRLLTCREGRRGVRWYEPRSAPSKNYRQKEGGDSSFVGMGNVAVQKSANNRGRGCYMHTHTVCRIRKVKASTKVYNIGTETENYFAADLLVHNCQDLSPLLYFVLDRIFTDRAGEVLLIGDDLQAIFSFAGVDPTQFLREADRGAKYVQTYTYRFGPQIVRFSADIASRVQVAQRRELVSKADEERAKRGLPPIQHLIRKTGSFEPDPRPGLILHRHVNGCQAIGKKYIEAGLPFRNERGADPLGYDPQIEAYGVLRKLAQGARVRNSDVGIVFTSLMKSTYTDSAGVRHTLVVRGGKKKTIAKTGETDLRTLRDEGILTELGYSVIREKNYSMLKHTNNLLYYDRLVKNGYDVDSQGPRITTIHGSKGRQHDRVVVFTEMSTNCWKDVDTEHRLAYVASTRTERELEICQAKMMEWGKTEYYYPEEAEDAGG